ncbi:MAG: hypothetical protein ACOC3V_01330 [bacterium]
MSKINIFIILLLIFSIGLVSSEECLKSEGCIGTFKQGVNDIELYQTCNNCTYCDFIDLRNNNNQSIISEMSATKDGNKFKYLLGKENTTNNGLGTYYYDYICGNNAENKTGTLFFNVTPSGNSDNLGFFILIFAIIYGVSLTGLLTRNEIITLIGGLSMFWLSIYLINEGFIIYRDWLTNGVAYLTLALGVYLAYISAESLWE